ncbi:MAG: sigma-70 family RNA polymerase sigma factor [Candidatus Aminicenantes bacterium]|nr:sigma-70 family RNA polymerase sigma factor [Candidatus Aminicenantes bacterium]
MNDQNDKVQDMIWRSREGDLSAFQQLVEHYQHYAYILAFRLLGDDEDAKDAVQEAFIRVWKHIKNFNLSSKFTTWFYRIVTNLCLDRIKAQKRKNRVFSQGIGQDQLLVPTNKKNPEENCINKDLAGTIIRLSEALTPKQHIVFVLRDLQDLDTKEVARISGMSVNSVKSNLFYARRNIRERLRQPDVPGGN